MVAYTRCRKLSDSVCDHLRQVCEEHAPDQNRTASEGSGDFHFCCKPSSQTSVVWYAFNMLLMIRIVFYGRIREDPLPGCFRARTISGQNRTSGSKDTGKKPLHDGKLVDSMTGDGTGTRHLRYFHYCS